MAKEKPKYPHTVVPFPESRTGVVDLMYFGQLSNQVHGLIEVDVTLARKLLKECKECTGENYSFTAFIIKCLGQAVSDNKFIHAMRRGKKELVLFDDADISCIVEQETQENENYKKMPRAYIMRSANKKSYLEIHQELRKAQTVDLTKHEDSKRLKKFQALPTKIRRWIMKKIGEDPQSRKQAMGTVGLTAVGMFGKGGGWAIPITPMPMTITLGGIGEKPVVRNGKIEVGEMLSITMSIDHDVVDGGNATRFLVRFGTLVQEAFGLTDLPKTKPAN